MGPYTVIAIAATESKTALWPETTQGDFKTSFVVSHKETPYRANKQQMQCNAMFDDMAPGNTATRVSY